MPDKQDVKPRGTHRPSSSRTTYHHGELREALTAEALRALEAGGPDAIGVRSLARAVAVYPTAVSHHFTDREGILAGLATVGLERLASASRSAVESAPDPTGRLLAVLRAQIDFAVAHPALYHLMFAPSRHSTRRHPERDAAGSSAMTVMRGAVEAWANQSGADGGAEPIVRYLWSVAHGLAMLSADDMRSLTQSDTSVDDVLALALRPLGQNRMSLENNA